jgi:hypothetical protein
MRKIKLMADYDCFPLWEADAGRAGDLDPNVLPISQVLKERLLRWASTFDATLDRDDPRLSGFATPAEKITFSTEGVVLGADLQEELGPTFHVIVQVP